MTVGNFTVDNLKFSSNQILFVRFCILTDFFIKMDSEEIRSHKSAIRYTQCQVTRQGNVIDRLLERPCSPKIMLEAIKNFDVARQKFSSALLDYQGLIDPTEENAYYN